MSMPDVADNLRRLSLLLDFGEYRFSWIAAGFIGSGIVVAMLAALVMAEEGGQRSPVRRAFALNMVFVMLFQIIIGLAVAAGSLDQAEAGARLGASVMGLVGASALFFACVMVGKRDELRGIRIVAWLTAIALGLVCVSTRWIAAGVQPIAYGYFGLPGPLLPLMLAHTSATMFGAIAVLRRAERREVDPGKRRQLRVVLVAYVAGMFTFPDVLLQYGLPWTPIMYVWVTLSALIMSYAIREHKAVAAPDFGWRAFAWMFASSLAIVALISFLWASRDWVGWGSPTAVTATILGLAFCIRGYLRYAQPLVDTLFLRRRYDHNQALGQLSDHLLVLHSAEAIAAQVAEVARRVIFTQMVALAIRDEAGKWHMVYSSGGELSPPEASDPILGWMLEGGGLVNVDTIGALDLSDPQREAAVGLCERYGAVVLFPVLTARSDQLIGLGALARSSDGRALGPFEHRFVTRIQAMLSSPLAAARLYDRRKQLRTELKRRVNARTAELNETMAGLKETQNRLVHREKMATLGVVVSGVAAELETAVEQVSQEVPALKQHLLTYDNVVQRYRGALPDSEAGREVVAWGKKVDLDYLRDDIDPLLAAVVEGASRANAIAEDMSRFARVDGVASESIDLHRELDSTINLLRHDFKGRVEVERAYDEDLPRVQCERGSMGQVFMNLIINAAQAISGMGHIRIMTLYDADAGTVAVAVRDDGVGIASDQIEHVFEPFYTTKSLGRHGGTGLGLSVSYRIIERHGGSITLTSEVGVGTEFCVTLPMVTG